MCAIINNARNSQVSLRGQFELEPPNHRSTRAGLKLSAVGAKNFGRQKAQSQTRITATVTGPGRRPGTITFLATEVVRPSLVCTFMIVNNHHPT